MKKKNSRKFRDLQRVNVRSPWLVPFCNNSRKKVMVAVIDRQLAESGRFKSTLWLALGKSIRSFRSSESFLLDPREFASISFLSTVFFDPFLRGRQPVRTKTTLSRSLLPRLMLQFMLPSSRFSPHRDSLLPSYLPLVIYLRFAPFFPARGMINLAPAFQRVGDIGDELEVLLNWKVGLFLFNFIFSIFHHFSPISFHSRYNSL